MESLAEGAGDERVGEGPDAVIDAGSAKGASSADEGFKGEETGDTDSASGINEWLGVVIGVTKGVVPMSTTTFSSLPRSTVTVFGSVWTSGPNTPGRSS